MAETGVSDLAQRAKSVAAALSLCAAVAQLVSGYVTGEPAVKSASKSDEQGAVQSCCVALVAVVQNQSVEPPCADKTTGAE